MSHLSLKFWGFLSWIISLRLSTMSESMKLSKFLLTCSSYHVFSVLNTYNHKKYGLRNKSYLLLYASLACLLALFLSFLWYWCWCSRGITFSDFRTTHKEKKRKKKKLWPWAGEQAEGWIPNCFWHGTCRQKEKMKIILVKDISYFLSIKVEHREKAFGMPQLTSNIGTKADRYFNQVQY